MAWVWGWVAAWQIAVGVRKKQSKCESDICAKIKSTAIHQLRRKKSSKTKALVMYMHIKVVQFIYVTMVICNKKNCMFTTKRKYNNVQIYKKNKSRTKQDKEKKH